MKLLFALTAYALAVVGLAELAARRWAWAAEWARKAIHVAVGVLPFGIVVGMTDRRLALLAPASFVLLNWLSHRFRLSRALDAVARPSLGTVYYPLSLLVLLVWLWDTPGRPLAAVAMLPMIIGDAAAAVVGTWAGRRHAVLARPPARPLVAGKTWAGTAAMFISSTVSLFAGLVWAWPRLGLSLGPAGAGGTGGLLLWAAGLALAVAAAVTVAELISPVGTDNLTVPLLGATLLWWLLFGPGTVTQLLLGLVAAAVVSALAWRLRALSASGAATATLVGGLVFAIGGGRSAILLLLFFISSSLVSRLGRHTGAGPAYAAKGSRRDWRQVFANGGVAVLAVVLLAADVRGWPVPLLAGSLAAATADTCATELGSRSRRQPRLLLIGRPVSPGTSGGITPVGLLASVGGALLIGAAAALLDGVPALLWAVLAGGVVGSLLDSVLGASVQAVRWCSACEVETERPIHQCGQPTTHRRGWPWLDNDAVNLLATTSGGAVAALATLL